MVNGIVILAAVALLFGGICLDPGMKTPAEKELSDSARDLGGTGFLEAVLPFAELFSGISGRIDAESA